MEHFLAIKRMRYWYVLQHGWTLKALCWMNEAVTEDHIYNRKCPNQANPQKQKVDWQLSGTEEVEEKWGVTTNGYGVSFGGDQNIQKIDYDNGYIIV